MEMVIKNPKGNVNIRIPLEGTKIEIFKDQNFWALDASKLPEFLEEFGAEVADTE